MSSLDKSDPKVTFRVETLLAGAVDMTYDAEVADEIATKLDRSVTILACPDCGDLVPVTGGIPQRMPTCPVCRDPLHGVTQVSVVRDDRAGSSEPTEEME